MSQIDFDRAGRHAHRLTGMSRQQVMDLMRDAARQISEQLVEAGIPVQSKRNRPDVGPVQIDMIVIQEKPTKPEPGMRLSFDIENDMGVTLNIKFLEFMEDPGAYTRNLFSQLAPMRRNMERRRRNHKAANNAIYKALTEGANG